MADTKITYPIVYKLKYPFEFGDEHISELRLRRAKGKEFRLFKGGDADPEIMMELLARLSGQPPALVDAMDMEDVLLAMDAMGNCLPSSPETSTKQ